MIKLIEFAPVYLNGLLAILFALVLPGLVFVRAFSIPDFPQRWCVIFLSSLTASHLLVTLIAVLHLDPVQSCRLAIVALIAALILVDVKCRAGSAALGCRSISIVLM